MRHHNRTLIPGLCSLLIGLGAATPAAGTSVVSLNLLQLTKASSDVVTGKVVDQQARFSDDGRHILTVSRIQVEKQVRGKVAKQTIEVVQPGGSIGDTTQKVSGMQLLRRNDSLLLFLQPESPLSARHKVTGFTQGIYRIQRDRRTGKMMAVPTAKHGVEKMRRDIQGKLTDDTADAQAMPLDDMLQTVEGVK